MLLYVFMICAGFIRLNFEWCIAQAVRIVYLAQCWSTTSYEIRRVFKEKTRVPQSFFAWLRVCSRTIVHSTHPRALILLCMYEDIESVRLDALRICRLVYCGVNPVETKRL